MRSTMVIIDLMPAKTSILQPTDEGVVSTSKSHYLRNTFYKVKTSIHSDSSDGSGQNKLKTFWKEFTISDAIKNIHDSWQKLKISAFTGVWEKLIPTLKADSEGFKISVERIPADVAETARELELKERLRTDWTGGVAGQNLDR